MLKLFYISNFFYFIFLISISCCSSLLLLLTIRCCFLDFFYCICFSTFLCLLCSCLLLPYLLFFSSFLLFFAMTLLLYRRCCLFFFRCCLVFACHIPLCFAILVLFLTLVDFVILSCFIFAFHIPFWFVLIVVLCFCRFCSCFCFINATDERHNSSAILKTQNVALLYTFKPPGDMKAETPPPPSSVPNSICKTHPAYPVSFLGYTHLTNPY